MKLKKIVVYLVVLFVFLAGAISKYSELIFIAHSYVFALGIIAIFIIFVGCVLFNEGEVHRFTFSPLVLIFVLAFLVLIPFSISKYDSIVETYRIVTPVLLFVVVINTIHDASDRKFYSYALVAFGLFIGVLSYVRFYLASFGSAPLDSIWGYTNTFAAFLVLEIFLSLGIYLGIEDKNIKRLFSVVPMFFLFLLFLTVSRGGYIAFALGGIVFLTISVRQLRKTWKDMLLVLVGSVVLIAVGSPKEIILANLGKSDTLLKFATGLSGDNSLWWRIHMALLAFKIFLERPITGFGLGTFRYMFTINETIMQPFRIDPHSLFFKLLAETGIVGTIAFFLFSGCVILKGFLKSISEKEDFIYKGLVAGIVGMLFHMCIDVDIYPIMFVVLFFALALLVEPDFVRIRIAHKVVFTLVGVVLVFVSYFNLLPKMTASRYAVQAESPPSLSSIDSYIALMNKAIALDSKSSVYYFYLGELVSKSQVKNESSVATSQMISAYKKSYKLNPYDYRAPFRLGMFYLPQRTSTALDYLLVAERLYPTNPNIQSWLSVAYCYVAKDLTDAYDHLNKAEEYNSGSLD
ncbi:MAG: O-antigen ligase family protein, partial [Caldisericaceae bacterium]